MKRNRRKGDVIELLRKENRPIMSIEICRRLGISRTELSDIMLELLKEGIVKRVFTKDYDFSFPFDTSSWILIK